MHFLSCAGELNHHGKYMCDAIYEILGEDFKRITTQKVDQERINLGYKENAQTPYNIEKINVGINEIKEIVSWCDVMDFGAAPEEYLEEAVRQNKVVFIRIERLLKEGVWKLFVPTVLFKYYRKYIRYRNNPNVYFLCVSAYAAADLNKIGIRGDRVLQWAYCPEFINNLDEKTDDTEKLQLLWCGRMIDWKHPEMAVEIAKELKKRNIKFELKMIGDGNKIDEIKSLIKKYSLNNEVRVYGAVESKSVREYMEKADIFLATSDRNEGWGVVINEAMNSRCAVFATNDMGAVPILIENEKNGFYIKQGSEAMCAVQIEKLAKNRELLEKIKNNAFLTIKNKFTPEVYASRFVQIADDALKGNVRKYEGLGERALIR